MEVFLPIAEVQINIILILFVSYIIGFLSGLFGVGGGFLMTPLLIFMGIPPIYAVANEANNILASSSSGALTHWFKKTLDIKIGWLKDMNGDYKFENGIIDMCELKLKELEKHNLLIDNLQPKINSVEMWDSWTTLRAKSIFEDIKSMNIKSIDEMTFQAIWEYKKGEKIKDDEIKNFIDKNFYNYGRTIINFNDLIKKGF